MNINNTQERHCIIISAGSFFGLNDTIHAVRDEDFIIAADAGFNNCRAAGLEPDLLIGDFDSMDKPKNFENLEVHPVEKDETDTLLAIRAGQKHGCNVFHIYGATGGTRLDHTLANIQTVNGLAKEGVRAYIYDSNYIFTAIHNEAIEFRKTIDGGIFSVFCFASPAKGVTIKGGQYTLENGELTPFFPIGVSNHFIENELVSISVEDGTLTICWEIPQVY